jgi:hypothetical protein
MPRWPERTRRYGEAYLGTKAKAGYSQGQPEASVRKSSGGQGVHREVESKGHEEKYRAVIDGGCPDDEPVGQRWGKVEPALWGRRRSHPPTAPRCLRTARYGRTARDLRRRVAITVVLALNEFLRPPRPLRFTPEQRLPARNTNSQGPTDAPGFPSNRAMQRAPLSTRRRAVRMRAQCRAFAPR